jgi:hypothetical protein
MRACAAQAELVAAEPQRADPKAKHANPLILRRRILRKLMMGSVVTLAVTLFVIAPSAFASSVGSCQLQGTANFSPGLNSSAQPFSYNFGGNLSGCQSSEAGVPTSGAVEAGKTIAEQVMNSKTGATDTVTYQEPIPSGNGGCPSSTTSGSALVTWADGTHTVESYSTTGALAAVSLSGSVAPSLTLTAVNAQEGDPTTFTIATNRFAGDSASGTLLFQPPEPTACNTPTGATSATISGAVSLSN